MSAEERLRRYEAQFKQDFPEQSLSAFELRLRMYQDWVESTLAGYFPDGPVPHETLLRSMRYSLLAGGKRLRPVLVLEFCRVCGGDVEKALPVACGVEMLHTYSLIHDDLPCMDNDDLRRGRPTNHKVFGEFTATLAGDALQAEAFASVLSADLPSDRLVRCARILASVAGHNGICGGQQLDMDGEGKPLTEADLMEIHVRKTAALIRGACLMGAAAAGGSRKQETAAITYADALGLAFQIRDDILDVTSTEEELGKPIGSDAEQRKTTFMTLFGERACEQRVLELTEQAKSAVSIFPDHAFLCDLADSLAIRNH